ncbi:MULTISPECIES: hypothetical protein [unclassified Pseudoalteromonas]|uniref:hypothetical protein n=1 Tax=unclassified Pseudoalteromonas TaxID=194690 RepID=UPI000B3D0E28|nr:MULTISPECIES: hypothetical protein [unclassified Pseudoalteromonas]MDN3379780.1 hypothetical protein [Pseudoalteromonas sp. APC 3893]MDN3388094.1 hypothetical protein [Pseudoalteromonas sp. APC 4017]OUS70366.1 hypothetical protein B5G52_14840 [Pseudoalteromonas sp. A601]
MTYFYLTLGCLLLVATSLLLRNATKAQRLLSLATFVLALICFITIYGNIAGVFVTITSGLLFGLLTAFILGKPKNN